MNRWRPSALVADTALALVFLVTAGLEYAFHGDDGYQAGPQWLNVAVSVAIALPVVVRRRHPVPALLVAYGAVVLPSLFLAHTLFFWSGILPLAILLYTLARHRRGAVAGWALPAPWALLVTYGLHLPEGRAPGRAPSRRMTPARSRCHQSQVRTRHKPACSG